jgi:hypothetical protein
MELNYDWKSFQSMFYPKKRLTYSLESSPASIYLISEGNVIISTFSEGEDLSDWIGATRDEVKAEFAHRELIFFNREEVDQWTNASVDLVHFYDQIQFLKTEVKPQLVTKNKLKVLEAFAPRHFFLQAIQSWWHKVLPSTYGVYISLDGVHGSSLLLTVQRGRIDSFYVPDLSSMMQERRRHPSDIVRFISERYLIPVQGIFLTSNEWMEWSESPNPWLKIIKAVKANRYKVVPFRWGLVSLIAIRAYFGF